VETMVMNMQYTVTRIEKALGDKSSQTLIWY